MDDGMRSGCCLAAREGFQALFILLISCRRCIMPWSSEQPKLRHHFLVNKEKPISSLGCLIGGGSLFSVSHRIVGSRDDETRLIKDQVA